MEERLIKRLMASIKCGNCGQCYEVGNINVLGHQEDLWFLWAICSACQTQYLVAAVNKEGRLPEIITDLTEAELDRFKDLDRIRVDDVLDMHNFLKDFDGDFPRHFRQR